MVLNKKHYVGRALDNRMGGFMIAEVARLLKENKVKLPFGLYVTNSVQEEVGLRGAEMIVERIKPDLAIVTDVTHDTQTPMMNKIQSGDIACGKGPVLWCCWCSKRIDQSAVALYAHHGRERSQG